MLFKEMIAVYSENHTKHINTISGKNLELRIIKACGTDIYHCTWQGYSSQFIPVYRLWDCAFTFLSTSTWKNSQGRILIPAVS
jgi:hypothetical protein